MHALFQKLFLTNSYFTIAIRRRSARGILRKSDFTPEFVMPARVEKWSADPILAEDHGRTWLFYEAVENDHGHIEVAEVQKDCTLGAPAVLLKDDCHYSYPFVFRWEGVWYMIPESSAAEEVRLYRAERFPDRWTLQEVLLRARAVDTTVYEQDGRLILLTFLTDGASERVTPKAYVLCLRNGGVELRPLDWAQFDPLQVRGAGPVFSEEGGLYRPVQVSQAQRYGDAVSIFRICDRDSAHTEEPAALLKTPDGKCAGLYVDGAHTYCRSTEFEAIDLRCRDFDFWKLPRKVLHRFGK